MATYAGQKVAFLTRHGKEQVVAPVLETGLGCMIDHVCAFDTDELGTFTRDTPRFGTQLEAARRKARIGMALAGTSLGIASEGSFGPDPVTGLLPWNVELLVWVDDVLGIEVVGTAQGAGRCGNIRTGDWDALEAFALREGFPQHHLVLRPQSQDDPRIRKGIADWHHLRACFDHCMAQSDDRQVFAETDLRAFANPSRMQNIALAAQDLLRLIRSCCPACGSPGFRVTERQPGLPCSACGLPTSNYRIEVWQCVRCRHQSKQARVDCSVAEPMHCSNCNP
jgi:hypothetical protein